jgi:mycothiol synthase
MEFSLRAPTEADLDRLVELFAEDAKLGNRDNSMSADDIVEEWNAPGQDRDRFNRVVEADGTLVGMSNVWVEPPMVHLSGFVSPPWRHAGIGGALAKWALGVVETLTDIDHIHVGHDASNEEASRFISGLQGFKYERSFMRMRNDLPGEVSRPEFGDALSLYRPDDPIAEMVRLRNLAFQDHWGYLPWTEQDLTHQVQIGKQTTDDWFFIQYEGEPAGFCRNTLREDRDGILRGYLGPIGTLRGFRGKGVARQLLRHSVTQMADKGANSVTLWVDSQNPFEATRLYSSNGFAVIGEWRVSEKRL